ncbi:MAG TPA: hypothetical protein VLF89_06405 [Candidatus Saccharimonadales bacterium]|nr:hypothetical protein [Candidatus Saccharimonadales bacterium]
MQKNLLLVSSFLLTFILTCIFTTYFLNYQQKTAVKGEAGISLVTQPWHIEGNKTFSVKSISLDTEAFSRKDTLLLTYNLHGLCMLGDTASEVILIDNAGTLHGVSLTKYGKNCFNGEQTINIPLTRFSVSGSNMKFTKLEFSFWYPTEYAVDITKMIAYSSDSSDDTDQKLLSPLARDVKAIPTTAPTLAMSPTAVTTISAEIVTYPTWQMQSISTMKVSKDIVCHPQSQSFIEKWVDTAKDLGVNYIAVETPYDSPSCGNSVAYTNLWISVIRSKGLHVWHRHSFMSFEGIYSTTKDSGKNYLQLIADYIKANPDQFASDDIFTPIPEPQNGGISGVTYCPQNICMFSSAKQFNQWIRDAIDISQTTFASINLGGKVKIGYFGFDGFVTWGNNNPQWSGILEAATVDKMGNITIDHYPEAVGDTMAEDLKKLRKKYPKTPVVIGEWGTIGGGDTVTQVKNTMGAVAADKNIVGFNYWQMSSGGNETLINDDFSHKPNFAAVQSFFKSEK